MEQSMERRNTVVHSSDCAPQRSRRCARWSAAFVCLAILGCICASSVRAQTAPAQTSPAQTAPAQTAPVDGTISAAPHHEGPLPTLIVHFTLPVYTIKCDAKTGAATMPANVKA